MRWLVWMVWAWLCVPAFAQEIVTAPTPEEESSWQVPPIPEDWVSVNGAAIQIHGHPNDWGVMTALQEHSLQAVPDLANQVGLPIGDVIQVFVAPTDADFRRLQPGKAPSWADATAYPALGVIYLRAPRARGPATKPLGMVMDHELVHVILGRAFYPQPTPSWLQEGMAQLMAGEHGPDAARAMSDGMASGGLIPLDSLEGRFPSDPVRARLAYAQSADFLAWLQQQYGDEALPTLVQSMAAGESLGSSVYRVTGAPLSTVEAAWRSRISTGIPIGLEAWTRTEALWGFGGILLVIGGVMRRRQFRRRLAEMEREEALVDAVLAQIRAERTTDPGEAA